MTLTSQEEQLLNSVRGRISLDAYIKQSALMRAKKAQKKQNKVDDPQHQEKEAAISKFLGWFCKRYEERFKCKYVPTVRYGKCPDREKIMELLALSDADKDKASKWIVERFFHDEFYIQNGCKLYFYSHNAYNDEAWSKKQQSKLRQDKAFSKKIVNQIPTQRVSPLARSEENRQKELQAHG